MFTATQRSNNFNQALAHEARLNRLHRLFKTQFNVTEPSMVMEPYLFLGNCISAHDINRLARLGIRYVLNVAIRDVEVCPYYSRDVRTLTIDLRDDDRENILRTFDQAFAFIDEARRAKSRVLVHCSHGQSRSPAIVIAYLMRSYHVSLEQCLGHVVQARPCVIPNDGFLKQLILYDRYLVERRRQQQQQQQQQEAARAQAAATAPVVEVPMQHHPSVSPQLVEKPATSQYSSVSDSKATHISSIDSSSAALSSSASGRSSPSVHSIHVIPIQVSSDVPMPKKTEPITIQQVSVDDGAPSVEPSKGKSPTCDKPLPDPSVAPHASSSRKRSQPRATHPTKQFFTQETRSDSRDPSNQNGHLPRQSSVILTPQQWSLINNYTPDFYGSDQPMPTKYITEIYDRATNRFIPTTCCY